MKKTNLHNYSLQEKQELQYLKQFNHLFWLPDIISNKYIFGTYDDSVNAVIIGNIIIYRMINSSNKDYIKFVRNEDQRAVYGYIFSISVSSSLLY